ncbi:MAG TPA: sulfite exporter TauE/SafE family protein [Candidatus Udaeobacter sp.]|nr:sulfite exporter TauE/SafE family protein [Candidatus Udaeobacter sp.]
MNTKIIPIRGMHCAACEILIGEELKKIAGVASVRVSQKKSLATIEYPETVNINDEDLIKAVKDAGYEVGKKDKLPWISRSLADYKDLAIALGIFLIIYLVARLFGMFDLGFNAPNSGVMVALLVGLVAGVSTCMALVGGLVLSLAARHAEQHPEATAAQKFRPHIFFNLGRIVGFAVLGGFVGLIGQAFKPANNLLGVLTVIIGGVMVFFGLKLIEIFPALRDKSITLPSGIAKFFGLNKEVKEYSHKGAIVMGVLTFFLPCGFTQAMQLYAVSTGSFWQGMAIMGLFAIGTAPGLLGIGGLTSVFKGRKARLFFMVAGLTVIVLGLFNISNGARLFGKRVDKQAAVVVADQNAQEVRMTQGRTGYSPNILTIKKDQPVKWIINSETSLSCAAYLVVPKYGISKSLRSGENIINFTPNETGEIPFSCSMGMYRGKFIVTE